MSDETLNDLNDDNAVDGITVIKAKVNDSGAEASFGFRFPDTAAEAITEYGDAVVLGAFKRAAVVAAQAAMRVHLKAGRTPEEVSAFMAENWQPGVSTKDPQSALMAKLASMEPDARRALLQSLLDASNG